MANELTLWGAGTGRTMRAHWMLLELGLDYEFYPLGARTGETLSAEFLALNPRHKIPVLRHRELVLTESAAIVQYLGECFGDGRTIEAPRDEAGRARINEWCTFVATELDAASLNVVRRHEGLAHLYGTAPTAVAAARQYFRDNVEAMAPRIAAGAPYLCGARLSAADVMLTTCLDWAVSIGIPLTEPLARYRSRLIERPAYAAARRRNFATAGAAPGTKP